MFRELSTIRDHIRAVLGVSGSLLDNSALTEYVNLVYRNVIPQVLYPPELKNEFSLSTGAGTADYGIDADMLSIVGPSYMDTDPVWVLLDERRFWKSARNRENEAQRKPTMALLFANQFMFYPIPDDTYTFYTVALARPSELVDDTDQIFDESWFLAVVYHAAARITYNWGDYEAYQAHTREAMGSVALARREQLARKTGQRSDPQF